MIALMCIGGHSEFMVISLHEYVKFYRGDAVLYVMLCNLQNCDMCSGTIE